MNDTKDYSKVRNDVKNLFLTRINLFDVLNSKYSIIRSNLKIWVENKEDNFFNINGILELHPNYFQNDKKQFFSVDPQNALILKKINCIFHKLIDDNESIGYRFFNNTHQKVDFKCKFYPADSHISKLEFDFEKHRFTLNSKELEIAYNMFKMFNELITKEQKEIIDNFRIKLESKKFYKLYTNKLFLSQLSTIADYYNTNRNK